MAATIAALVMALTPMGSAYAGRTTEQRCQSAKNDLAAKYAVCRGKAEGKLAGNADAEAYAAAIAKCDAGFAAGWDKIEAKATDAGGTCANVVSEEDLRDYVSAFSIVIADVAGSGEFPPDTSTCAADLSACQSEAETCQGEFATASGGLATWEQDLACGNNALDARRRLRRGDARRRDLLVGDRRSARVRDARLQRGLPARHQRLPSLRQRHHPRRRGLRYDGARRRNVQLRHRRGAARWRALLQLLLRVGHELLRRARPGAGVLSSGNDDTAGLGKPAAGADRPA